MPTLFNGTDDESSNNHSSGKDRSTIMSCTNSGVQLWSMSRRGAAFFRGSSGSYNVRASELARQKRQQQQQQQQQQRHLLLRGLLLRDPPQLKLIPCIVFFLDDTQHNFDMDKGVKGQVLLDAVFQHLELIEKDYFGLQYADVAPAPDALRWLDPTKSLRKQMRVGPPYLLYFRVKFYISDPSKLQEEYTRYHFFLQVKKDMVEGRLVVPAPTAALLASYSVQSELGDYNPEEHRSGYLTELRLVPEQSPEIERRITELHKLHRGQTPADAEYNFLDHAKRLDMYGVDSHRARVRDSTGAEIQLGVTSTGLVVFQNNVRINTFSWAKIVKISFKRKQFFIQLRRQGAESYDNLLGFNMLSYRSCKNLWKSCVEHHSFFRLHTPRPPPPKKLLFFLSLGSRFRYSGRTEYQTVEEGKRRARPDRTFMRSPSRRYTQPRVTSLLEPIGPTLTLREPPKPKITLQVPPSGSRPMQIMQQLVGKGETPSTSHPRSLQISQQQQIVRPYDAGAFGHVTSRISETDTYVKPRKAWTESPDSSSVLEESQRQSLQSLQPPPPPQIMVPMLGQVYGHPRTPLSNSSIGTSSSLIGHVQPSTSHDRGSLGLSLMMKGLEYMDDEPASEELYDVPSSQHLGPGSSSETSASTNGVCPYRPVTVRLVADDNGRFGFNVKGGADQGMSSILVSRVAPGTPASLCTSPGRLREGDQVISIDGQDVAGLTHEQVVNLIRNAGESSNRELHLQIYPNILYGDRTQGDLFGSQTNGEGTSKMEPDFMYIPAYNHQQQMRFGTSGSTSYCDELVASMLMLSEQCETGSLELQYARVERRMSNLTCEVAERPENRACNRYSDVLAYDSTRVTLQNGSPNGGDYVNANYVNMEIPSSGLTNRYIATQGPLFRTSSSFWQMVWEQSAPLILMLTQTKEGNHAKCFQYWPEPLTFAVYGKFKVTNVREVLDRDTSTFMVRQFMLTNTETGESREITQLQYLNWPDYGVPADPTDFIKFVLKVRKMMGESATKPLSPSSREESGVFNRDVAVVHCSAGVGRTGVFILVDTAMCLIEANEPVYPQETLRNMRRWRALLVQNYQQYHFACQIILRCFNEELVVPLPEYSRRT